MPNNHKSIAIAMSGGVDSSAVAYMLKQQGHNVFGITMDLLSEPYKPTESSIKDAKVVADKIGIEHYFLDLRKEFYQQVVKYFTKSYIEGLTPSPCIMCNREIKLGLLAKKAIEMGADLIVTGHYADIRETPHGVELHQALDPEKDQSYFLFAVDKEILQKLRCPLAHMTKQQTRDIAKKIGLTIHKKEDSQDICFVPNGKYTDLIKESHPEFITSVGNIITKSGKIVGRHNGIINYTIGQRKGLGIGGNEGPFYVTGLNTAQNEVIVGSKQELLQKSFKINQINWLGEAKPQQLHCEVKVRSRQALIPAIVTFGQDNTATVELKTEYYGIAPGQGCCFYDGTRVLGGGFITK